MRKQYLERIKQGILLFDGAMGTMLYKKGIFINQCFETLCLTKPDLIKEIHSEYIKAGAEVIESNSYGANVKRLAAFGMEDKLETINKTAVKLAREVAGGNIYVAGSVGPLGGYIEPRGRITREEAREMYKRQISSLLEEDVDLILFETYKNIDELLLAVNLCRELSTDIPIQAQFTVNEDMATDLGTSALQMTTELNNSKAVDVVGINCSVGPADILEVLRKIRNKVEKPVAVMPNAGYPREVDGRLMYLSSPEYFASYSRRFIDAGANIIGGCCGTTPKHISEIAKGIGSRTVINNFTLAPASIEVTEKKEVPLEERSRLGYLLSKKRWVSLVELIPPMGTSLDKIISRAAALNRSGVAAINLPDGPRASARVSSMITAIEMEREARIETIIHYCCRDRNLIGMQSDMLGAHAAGLRNVLIVTGDPPKLGRYPDATGVFDVDAIGLTTLVSRLNRGVDFGGNEMASPTSFVLGVGANPASLSLEQEVEKTFKKMEAGAHFIITQPVFDVDILLKFLEKIKRTGLPVIAGAWPLASYKNALFLQNEVPEVDIPEDIMEKMRNTTSKEEGIAMGIEITRQIMSQVRDEISGIQISPPFGRISTAQTLIDSIDAGK